MMGMAAPRDSHLEVVPTVGRGGKRRQRSAGSVQSAAARSERELLIALRNKIAADIDAGVPPRDLASLSKRLMEITRELASIEAEEDGDDVGAAAATPDEPWDG